MSAELHRALLRNTVTNYICLAWRLITAIFVTRFLYLGLGENLYGFWALLWTIFGYSLLFDFGFGTAVQKYTSEATVTKDFKTYNNIISAVVGSYAVVSLFLLIATYIGGFYFKEIFTSLSEGEVQYYRNAFLLFGFGVSISFSTGIMPAVLEGLLRHDLRNYVIFGVHTINLIGVYLIFSFGYSLMTLIVFTLGVNLIANIIMFCIVKRIMPEFKVSLKNFKLEYLRDISGFSLYAYFFTIATIIVFRTDRVILGVMLTIGAVTVYHLGTRLSDIMEKLTSQFQDSLSPVAASLYRQGNLKKLNAILLKSNRIAAFTSVGAFSLFYLLAEPILFVWLKVNNPTSTVIAQLMLISVFVSVLFRSSSFKFLQMAGMHQALAIIMAVEAVANICLSIYLVKKMGVVGVALGTLIPNCIISILIVFPIFSSFGKVSILYYLKKIYLPIAVAALPTVLLINHIKSLISLDQWNLANLAMTTTIAALLYVIMSFYLFLNHTERLWFKTVLHKRRQRNE